MLDPSRDEVLVRQYLHLANTDHEASVAMEHPDVRFWLSGRLIMSGHLTPEQHRRAAAGVHETFPGGYSLHIDRVVAAGGNVAVEARGEGTLADGSRYEPSYAMFFEIVDGKVASLHEYIDTEYVAATFNLPLRRDRGKAG